MITVQLFALGGLAIALGAPDSDLITPDAQVAVPVVEALVGFDAFIIVAPIILIVLQIYLQIFFGYWLRLNRFITANPRDGGVPTLFSLDHWIPNGLGHIALYWTVPAALIGISWKASARLEWGVPLGIATIATVLTSLLLLIRRCSDHRREECSAPIWITLLVIVLWTLSAAEQFETGNVDRYRRPLNLANASLEGSFLGGGLLRDANLRFANLRRSNLQSADLRGANLEGAQLQSAILINAKLQGANLSFSALSLANFSGADLDGATLFYAELEDADLSFANLEDTDLRFATLQGADLDGANLRGTKLEGADITGVRDTLSCFQLQHAIGWEQSTRDPELQCVSDIVPTGTNQESSGD